MSYFAFLLQFIGLPVLVLLGLTYWDRRQGRKRAAALSHWPAALGILLHIFIAVLYTTPWDNYLVATRVWWYDPDLVTGITLGWVPIEEYTFFIVQPILSGLWLWLLARRLSPPSPEGPSPEGPSPEGPSPEALTIPQAGTPPKNQFVLIRVNSGLFSGQSLKTGLRWALPLLVFALWITAVLLLLARWQPGTYLALELGWALPPIILQLVFGADILWRYRRLVFLSIVPLTLYLSTADALAINFGTWTINPAQSLNLLIGGILPVEEFLFFLLTNTLITFGLVLLWAKESHQRLKQIQSNLFRHSESQRRKRQAPITNP